MKKEFTKSDLENGMVVETRDETRFLVNGDILVGEMSDWDKLEIYSDNLTVEDIKECDIVKIYTTNSYYIEHMFDDDNLTLIWERTEEIPMETKCYVIEQHYVDETVEEDEPTIIKITPNNYKGYHKADSNCPIYLDFDEYYGFGLTIDSAKEMIKDLQEIVDYMEEK